MQAFYEQVRAEALASQEPPSWACERVRHYGVASLWTGVAGDRPFILYSQNAPRPPWSGKRDIQRERLHQAYEFLTREVNPANGPLCPSLQRATGEGTDDRLAVGGSARLCQR